MKNLKIGKALNKVEQKAINGGNPPRKRRKSEECDNLNGITYSECMCAHFGINCPIP